MAGIEIFGVQDAATRAGCGEERGLRNRAPDVVRLIVLRMDEILVGKSPLGHFRLAQILPLGIFWRVPRKIRQLVNDLRKAGFTDVPGGKGSHRKFVHPKVLVPAILSGHDGDDAKPYLEKHVAEKIHESTR